jgi:hypothetical protein
LVPIRRRNAKPRDQQDFRTEDREQTPGDGEPPVNNVCIEHGLRRDEARHAGALYAAPDGQVQ